MRKLLYALVLLTISLFVVQTVFANNIAVSNIGLTGRNTAAKFTLVQFDSQDPQEVVCEAVPIREVTELNENTFVPRASTPLFDALGLLIHRSGERLAAIPEPDRPGTVIFAILTDGLENASREFTRQRVFDLIREQQDVYKWNFIYLGANQDAFVESQRIGIRHDAEAMNVLSYQHSGAGVLRAYDSLSGSAAYYASGKRPRREKGEEKGS